jgi:hypothetical protein
VPWWGWLLAGIGVGVLGCVVWFYRAFKDSFG